jgi:hypothetical protein
LCAPAAELKILMHSPDPVDQNGLDRPLLAIDAGDTVTWQASDGFFSGVQSYTGDWKSPPLTTNGATYSMTFNQTGLYLYEALGSYGPVPGAITVLGWTNQPPAISINNPVDGFVLTNPRAFVRLDASVRVEETNILRVDFWANANLIGSLTNAPFSLLWTNSLTDNYFQPGSYSLFARAIDRNGNVYTSRSVVVGVVVAGVPYVASRPRYLSDATFVFYYSVYPDAYYSQFQWIIVERDDLSQSSQTEFGPSLNGDGVFFDPFVGGSHTNRFYWVRQVL